MNENNWKEFSNDISSMSKKIKSSITDEENLEDLKNSLKAQKIQFQIVLMNLFKLSKIL